MPDAYWSDFSLDGESALEQIAKEREKFTDELLTAIDDEAEKHNAYLAADATAYAHAVEDGVAATVRAKHASKQQDVVAKEKDWNRAKAAKERAKTKCDELADRMMAAQSYYRMVRGQT